MMLQTGSAVLQQAGSSNNCSGDAANNNGGGGSNMMRSSPFSQQSPKLVMHQQASLGAPQLSSGGPTLMDVPPPLPPLQLPQQQQRQRQQLGMGLSSAFPMQPLSMQAIPPLFATPQELSLLEPQPSPLQAAHVPHTHPGIFFDAAPQHHHPLSAPAGVLDLMGRGRTISSPSGAWNDKPVVSSGHGMHHPQHHSQQQAISHHHSVTQQGSGMGSQQGMGSTSSVAAAIPSLAAGLAAPGLALQLSNGAGGDTHNNNHRRVSSTDGGACPLASPTSQTTGLSGDVLELSPVARTLNGPAAAVVKQMLAEIPAPLQPVVMAKVAVRGRGGRQPAADPRAADPDMDPRKVRRILANRQSAARSKMKQRVLLETLRVNKEVMAAQQTGVQEELQRLAQLVHDLQARNKQLEDRLQQVLTTQQHNSGNNNNQQQTSASQNGSAATNAWPGLGVAAGGPPSPMGAAAVLNLELPQQHQHMGADGAATPTARAFGGHQGMDDRAWWGEHPMDL